jgi:hypothetical protein
MFGKKQKMIVKKNSKMMIDFLAKAILFFALAIVVFLFLKKFFTVVKPIPPWSRSLSNLEKSIKNLDPNYIDLTRTATVSLKNEFIKGFTNESEMYVEDKNKKNCICVCFDSDCSNAKDDSKKYCKTIKYKPNDDFIIDPASNDPITYDIGLERISGEIRVSVAGFTR